MYIQYLPETLLFYMTLTILSFRKRVKFSIAKISVTSPIVINMPTRELLAGETKSSFV